LIAAVLGALLTTMVLAGCSGGAPSTARVSISKTDFQPTNIVIKAGGTVTWTNNDTIPHTVTAEDMTYDSRPIYPGKTFSQQFVQPGTYGYFCRFVTTLKGTVTVK
jgi:plastocyanin